MKLTFLGTGAADWPLQREAGMTEFRRLSSLLIDDTLLIDPGPQVPQALRECGKRPEDIRSILVTHKHSDHFCMQTLQQLVNAGATLYEPQDRQTVTIDAYTVRAYNGNHATSDQTLHYLIRDGTRTLFYGLDGAWLLYEEVQAILQYRPDIAVLDATIGFCDGDYRIFEHNNLNMVLEMQKTLRDSVGRFCISHMARTLHTDHKTLCRAMEPHGILVASDGLELNI